MFRKEIGYHLVELQLAFFYFFEISYLFCGNSLSFVEPFQDLVGVLVDFFTSKLVYDFFLAAFFVGFLKRSLELLKLLCFRAGGMRLLPHILDLIPNLLKEGSIVVSQAVDELLVCEQIVAYKLCGQLGIDVCFHILVEVFNSLTARIELSLGLCIIIEDFLHLFVELLALKDVSNLVTDYGLHQLLGLHIETDAVLRLVAVYELSVNSKARLFQLFDIGKVYLDIHL